MKRKLKFRIIIASVIIIATIVAVVAVVGSFSSAKSVSISQAHETQYIDKNVQVQGLVVSDSYSLEGKTAIFSIYDPNDVSAAPLQVRYAGALSSTFGNGVTAICTGKMGADGVLKATELVTKCPSKYESSSNALSIAKLMSYGDSVYGKIVKIAGIIKSASLVSSGTEKTFVLMETTSSDVLAVSYAQALGDGVKEGSAVVLTGMLGDDGVFVATEVNLQE